MDETLRAELLAMRDIDQVARDPVDPATMERVDREHTERLRAIVVEHGWPGRTLAGDDRAQAAWLLAQHADRDPGFQASCLELLRAAVEEGEAPASQLAYLHDRVAVHAGEPQRYGTQFRGVTHADGTTSLEPYPLEDPDRVDALRAAVGLEPLDEYRRLFEQR